MASNTVSIFIRFVVLATLVVDSTFVFAAAFNFWPQTNKSRRARGGGDVVGTSEAGDSDGLPIFAALVPRVLAVATEKLKETKGQTPPISTSVDALEVYNELFACINTTHKGLDRIEKLRVCLNYAAVQDIYLLLRRAFDLLLDKDG